MREWMDSVSLILFGIFFFTFYFHFYTEFLYNTFSKYLHFLKFFPFFPLPFFSPFHFNICSALLFCSLLFLSFLFALHFSFSTLPLLYSFILVINICNNHHILETWTYLYILRYNHLTVLSVSLIFICTLCSKYS